MNATEHRRWWAESAPVAYGLCWCGCGQNTSVPTKSSQKLGRIKGEPMRFIRGHSGRKGPTASPSEYRRQWEEDRPDIPFGFCFCGCGERTESAKYTTADRGWVKGQPIRYIKNHRWGVVNKTLEAEICRRTKLASMLVKLPTPSGAAG